MTDFLTEDTINPSNQVFICVSFFSKNYVKQIIDNNNEHLPDDKKENYNTDENVFALKFRGAFSTYNEACDHCKKLNTVDPYHNVYVMEANKWCAFMVDDNDKYVKQTEYANDQLNDMMKKYVENQEKAKLFHEYRKNEMMSQSIIENLDNKQTSLEETKKLLDECNNKEDRLNLKERLLTLEEQIEEMTRKRDEVDEQTKLLADKLKLGQL
jgi:hypothetical protein